VALVPLYGDPRQSPVSHPEWARMVLRGLELDDALEPSRHASDIFTTLSWRTSLAYPAEEYQRSQGMALHERDGHRLMTVTDPIGGEASYHLAVVRGGDYRVRLRLAGTTSEPAWAEIVAFGETDPIQALRVQVPAERGWVDAGGVHLGPGTYHASVLLPEGCELEFVELAPPCINPIEPIGGWRSGAVAHVYDVAVTTLQAVDMEHELAPADEPDEFGADRFALVAGTESMFAGMQGPDEVQGRVLRASQGGMEAIVAFEIPREGLYSVLAYGEATGGQTWTADGCQKATLCPSAAGARWWPVLSNRFEVGRHSLAVRMAAGSALHRVRVVRKKDSPEDYLGALRRLGLDLGDQPGPISRSMAADAMDWIEKQRREAQGEFCAPIAPVEPSAGALLAGAPGGFQTPGAPPPFTGTPPTGGNPTTPPIGGDGFPPGLGPPGTQPPASPVIP
jgi:hypothetical protein